jgi:integrase
VAVRKLSGRWAVEFELRKHRVFRRLPSGATKGQAEALEARLRGELIDVAVVGRAPKISLVHAIDDWAKARKIADKSEMGSKVRLTKLGLKELKIESASLFDVQSVADRLTEHWAGLQPATINRRLCVLKATCRWAWKVKRWTPTNLSAHIELLSGEVARTRALTEPEVATLIFKAQDPQTKAFIALGAYALLRQGEAMRKDVLRNGLIYAQSKNGPMRVLEPVQQMKPHLGHLPLTLHKRTLYGRFEAARDAAGLVDLNYHDLRRSGATILLNRGVALEVVAAILGDSLETTRKHYAHVLKATVSKAMRKGFKPIKIPAGKGGPGGI